MINHWGEECSMKLPKTMTIELDQILISALASIETQKDIGVTEDLVVYENYGMNDSRTSKADEDPQMDGLMNRTQTHDTLLRGVFAPKQTS